MRPPAPAQDFAAAAVGNPVEAGQNDSIELEPLRTMQRHHLQPCTATVIRGCVQGSQRIDEPGPIGYIACNLACGEQCEELFRGIEVDRVVEGRGPTERQPGTAYSSGDASAAARRKRRR